jgi:hypothetical protein
MRKIMSDVILNCAKCGRYHGSIFAMNEAPNQTNFSSLIAANTDFQRGPQPSVRKSMSAREAMAITKVRYKETIEYLA